MFKTEPSTFSIDDLAASPDRTAPWDGVRNYQARNLLRDEVMSGDLVLIYHSSVTIPGVAGVAVVVRAGYADRTALDARSQYYDPAATEDNPRWYAVDVRFLFRLKEVLPLTRLKETPGLEKMMVVQRGARLSIQPVTEPEWQIILGLIEPLKV